MRDNPWATLPPAAPGEVSALRADPVGRFAFFWARKADSRYAFILELASDPGDVVQLPRLRGIEVEWVAQFRQLQLVLATASDLDMFHVVCQDLMLAAARAAADVDCMHTLVQRLFRWQRLLSHGGPRLMDERGIRGLIAELIFLRDDLLPRLGPRAVSCWQGPAGLPQDFGLGDTLFEIKSHLVGSAPDLAISSADQLWSGGATLYLRVFHLGRVVSGGECLPELVAHLAGALRDHPAMLELFETNLARVGYIDLPQYGEFRYDHTSADMFEVVPGFPMLGPDSVPPGVVNVRYSVRLDACAPFRATPDWNVLVAEQI